MALSEELKRTYLQAAKEAEKKLNTFWAKYRAKDAQKRKLLEEGKITEAEYKRWREGQMFTGERWKEKLDDITQVYVDADKKAREIIGGTEKNVFVKFANSTGKDIGKHVAGFSFDLYDKRTVELLLKTDPTMLPRWKINEKKDYVWNEKRVKNAVAQGIIQGESIDDIGKRLTKELSAKNADQMTMFARTAITGAQNAGRMDMLHNAQDMGIKVKKKWLATLDQRTRDAHRDLDGQVVDIDEPFIVDGQKIMFPGDPNADPSLVYNCRCTLTYVYPKYQPALKDGGRREQTTGKVIKNQTYREWDGTKKEEPAQDKQRITVATTREEAYEVLKDTIGFHEVGDSIKHIDDKTVIENANQLSELNAKFGVIKEGHNGHITAKSSSKFEAATNGYFAKPNDQSLVLSLDYYAHGHDAVTRQVAKEMKNKWAMPCSEDKLSVYTVTHEYGHMLENMIIHGRVDMKAYEAEVEKLLSSSTSRDLMRIEKKRSALKREYTEKNAKKIFQEILHIAHEDDPNFSLKENISDYGKTNYEEAFAETFANSQLGKPNALGRAMIKWLAKELG